MSMLQLELLLPNDQLLIALFVLRDVAPNVQELLQQVLVRAADARQARLVQLLDVLPLATQHLLQFDAASLQVFYFQVDLVLFSFDFLSDSQSKKGKIIRIYKIKRSLKLFYRFNSACFDAFDIARSFFSSFLDSFVWKLPSS